MPRLAGRRAMTGRGRLVIPCAVRRGLILAFDGDVGSHEALHDLARRANHAISLQLGLPHAPGRSAPEEGLIVIMRAVPGPVGVTLGRDGFL